jgi:hypothetical protein
MCFVEFLQLLFCVMLGPCALLLCYVGFVCFIFVRYVMFCVKLVGAMCV